MSFEPSVDGIEPFLLCGTKAWLPVVAAEEPDYGGDDYSIYSVVVHAVHQVVSASIFVEILGVGQRVSPQESALEAAVTAYEMSPPPCRGSEVFHWVRVLAPDYGVGSFAVFANK